MMSQKLAIAITGASGSIYSKILLDRLLCISKKNIDLKIGVVLSDNAAEVWRHELGNDGIYRYPFNY